MESVVLCQHQAKHLKMSDADIPALERRAAIEGSNRREYCCKPYCSEGKGALPGLILYRRTQPVECGSGQYEPSLNVFGRKRIHVAGLPHDCDESSFLLTSVDLPVTSQILEASVEKPLLAFLLKFDMSIVREVVSPEEEPTPDDGAEVGGMAMDTTFRGEIELYLSVPIRVLMHDD